MAYNARGIQFPGGDYGASLIAQSGRSIGEGINSFGAGIAEALGNREKSKALDASMDQLAKANGDIFDPEWMDKFHKGGVTQKGGMFTTALAMMQRKDDMAKQAAQQDTAPVRFTTPGGHGAYYNKQTGAITSERELEPPALPKEIPGHPNMGMNANGTVFEFPPLPNDDGAAVHPIEGTGYSFATFNGKPVTGAVPNIKTGDKSINLQPIPGTDYAVPVGADGKPLKGQGMFKAKQPANFMDFWKTLQGKGTYEPVQSPAKGQDPNKVTYRQSPDGLFATKGGRTYRYTVPTKENARQGNQPAWEEVPGLPSDELSSPILPPLPGADPQNPDILLPPGGRPVDNQLTGPKPEQQKPVRKIW